MQYKIPIEILETEDGGCHLLLEARFSNNEKGWLIIDTGANKTVFDINLASNQFTLLEKINQDLSAGINASIDNSYKAILHLLALDDFKITNYETIAINLDYLNNIYKQISDKQIWGLIGGDFLLNYKCRIDYKSKKLHIFETI